MNFLVRISFGFWFSVFVLTFFCGCWREDGTDQRNVIVVSVEPHAFLVEQIGGTFVQVEVLVPMGKEPESYQPTPDRIVMLTRAKVFFRTGMPFEQTIIPKLKSIASDLRVVDLRKGIKLRPLEFHNHISHDHNSHDRNSHDYDSSDPHIWYSLNLLKIEAVTVMDTLIAIDPTNEVAYRKNCGKFVLDVEFLREKLQVKLESVKGKSIFVFHPTYGYFCDEFNLNQRAIEVGGKTPMPQQLVETINAVKKSSLQTGQQPTIFVQPEFNRTPAKSVAEVVNGRIVEHSALERDIFKSMINFADEITR